MVEWQRLAVLGRAVEGPVGVELAAAAAGVPRGAGAARLGPRRRALHQVHHLTVDVCSKTNEHPLSDIQCVWSPMS